MYEPLYVKKQNILLILIFLICVSFYVNGQEKKIVYSDSSTSKMVVTKMDITEMGRTYSPIEFSIQSTTYSVEQLIVNEESDFFAVKKTSKLDGGQPEEGNGVLHHLISVDFMPLTNNKLKSFSIKYDCDDIVLHNDYYETITYGCCGAETIHTYYLYNSNKEICEGAYFKSYEIPGRGIECFVGFESYPPGQKDSIYQFIFIGYNNGEMYKINVSNSQYLFRSMEFETGNPGDKFMGTLQTTQRIYSLEKIPSVDQINNLKISLVFKEYNRDNTEDEKVVDIPIINGKPFGKDSAEQTLNISEIK